jgi:4-hydroxy-3-polyprenylbenzoate decarboxylase
MSRPFVLAVTGASGVIYGQRLLEVLLQEGHEVHLTISPSGAEVITQELQRHVDLDDFRLDRLLDETSYPGTVHYHHYTDFMSPIASGSYLTRGMVICPCSGSTLSAVVYASGANLIHRAADVHLKERRKLVLVPRETPLSVRQLDNMKQASEAGAVVLPASPGWYHGVQSTRDLVDFIVARILDQFEIPRSLMTRWGEEGKSGE